LKNEIGPTGNIGGEIVRLLKEKNADFIAATNSRSIDGVDSVALNFADTQSLEAAMQRISTLFMVLANHPDMIALGKNVIDTAKKCGVKHIVRSGGSLADGNSSIGVRKVLAETARATAAKMVELAKIVKEDKKEVSRL